MNVMNVLHLNCVVLLGKNERSRYSQNKNYRAEAEPLITVLIVAVLILHLCEVFFCVKLLYPVL